MIVEIGGTVGDIESLPFVESLRQMRQELGRQDTVFVHLTLVPYIQAAGELKTKPTQHSVKQLLEIGIQPDILLCRTDRVLSADLKAKIALFCNVATEAVITAQDVDCVYEVPLTLGHEGLDEILLRYLSQPAGERHMEEWERLVERVRHPTDTVTIGVVGKYVEFEDSYKSLKEALVHGGLAHDLRVDIRWMEAEGVEGPDWAQPARRARRHPRAGRLRKARHRRHDPCHRIRTHAQGPLLRHLPGNAVRRDRVCAQRLRAQGGRTAPSSIRRRHTA